MWPIVLGVFISYLQISVFIVVREVKVLHLPLTVVTNFNFACFCVYVTFSFVSLPSAVKFGFACLNVL